MNEQLRNGPTFEKVALFRMRYHANIALKFSPEDQGVHFFK